MFVLWSSSSKKHIAMNDVIMQVLLLAVSMWSIEVSCLFEDYKPKEFAIKRYIMSRTRTADRPLDPATEFNEVLDFMGLVNQFGYPAEEHSVTTVDGYKLGLHRIPGSPKSPKAKGKPIVYFQHGLLASSDTWVLRGPNQDLAFILADAGYDVWAGNARGNTYSRAHVSLSPDDDAQFWDFSWHEIALYDVSASIDYILEETSQERLIYIGHSMGTTVSYVLLSVKPEYNDRVELVISLAPVALWHDRPSFTIRLLVNNIQLFKLIMKIMHLWEIFPLTIANSQIAMIACTEQSPFQPICLSLIDFLFGHNPKELNTNLLPYFLSYYPAGTSVKSILHYGQNVISGRFQMYNDGIIHNFRNYGSTTPPLYNLSKIIAPVAIFYSRGDTIVTPGDPLELAIKLPNVVTVEAVPDKHFTHLDFIFGTHLKTLVLDRVLDIMNKTLKHKKTI